jgi:hypothetical protein
MYKLTQHKFWGALALIMSIMLVFFMVACGDDDDDDDNNDATNDDDDDAANDDDDDDAVGPPSATDVTVDPPAGATVPSNQEFKLSFNEGVTAATANGVAATGSGRDWTVTPFAGAQGQQNLAVEWTNRDSTTGSSNVGSYTVDDPDVAPAEVTTGTVADGDVDVDPATVNAGIRIDFNEAVNGTIDITDEAGASLKWTASVAGQTATLTPVAGTEAANETTYKIEVKVKDGAGNETNLTITFVTKAKE